MISFMLPLSDREWDPELHGWRCPALKLPGIEIGDLYAKGKVHPDCYRVDAKAEVVHWCDEDEAPPKHACVSVRVPDDLKTHDQAQADADEASVFWKRLTILVPVIVALIAAAGGWKAASSAGGSSALAQACETWTVMGETNARDLNLTNANVLARMEPPSLYLDSGGGFKWSIPVVMDRVTNQPLFPRIDLGVQGLGPNDPKIGTSSLYMGEMNKTPQSIVHKDRRIDFGMIKFDVQSPLSQYEDTGQIPKKYPPQAPIQ